MTDPIIVVPYDDEWPALFQATAVPLRQALADTAVRIDHIGSTAVPGLAAKPIIDIQISVSTFEPFTAILQPMEGLGYCWRDDNDDLSKRYFRESEGSRRTHIHVRRWGSWSQQTALLFRDYLRLHPDDLEEYARVKYQLAEQFRQQREAYVEAKSGIVWQILQKAARWSQLTGWEPGPSDA